MTLDAYRDFLYTRAQLAFYEKHFPIMGFEPMSVQRDFIGSTAKVSVFSAGNRAGKTHGAAWKAAALANGVLGHFYPGFPDDGDPTRGWVSALDYRLAEVCKRKLQGFLGSTLRRWYERDQMFLLHNGSEIVIKSEESGEQKYQAEDVHWAWKDEAGDAKAEGVYNEIIRGLTDANGPLFISMTPTLGSSWIGPRLYEPWNKVAQDRNGVVVDGVAFFFGNTEDNIHLSRAGLKTFVSMQVTDAQKAVRLRGRFVVLEGLVYSMFDERRHVVPSFPIPREWMKWRCMDWGLVAPSTCLWLALEPATDKNPKRLHAYREVYDTRPGKTVPMTADLIKDGSQGEEYVQTILDPSCWNRDPAPESVGGFYVVADHFASLGIYAERGNNEMEPSVERIWRYLGNEGTVPQLLIHDCCPMLIHEMKHQRWKRNVMGLSAQMGMNDKIEKADPDHLLDPLRYGVMAGMMEEGVFQSPSEDPFLSQIPDAAAKYEWKLVDGKAVLVGSRPE